MTSHEVVMRFNLNDDESKSSVVVTAQVGSSARCQLTAILLQRLIKDLKRAQHIHSIHSRVKGKQHLHDRNWTSGLFHG